MSQTLYLIRGVPGSGKSSLANELYEFRMVDYHFEADDYFFHYATGEYAFDPSKLGQAHQNCQQNARDHLCAGFDVAVSNTSTTEKEVQVYEQIAKETGSKFVSIVVESRHDGKNLHGVPEEKVQAMKNRFSVKL